MTGDPIPLPDEVLHLTGICRHNHFRLIHQQRALLEVDSGRSQLALPDQFLCNPIVLGNRLGALTLLGEQSDEQLCVVAVDAPVPAPDRVGRLLMTCAPERRLYRLFPVRNAFRNCKRGNDLRTDTLGFAGHPYDGCRTANDEQNGQDQSRGDRFCSLQMLRGHEFRWFLFLLPERTDPEQDEHDYAKEHPAVDEVVDTCRVLHVTEMTDHDDHVRTDPIRQDRHQCRHHDKQQTLPQRVVSDVRIHHTQRDRSDEIANAATGLDDRPVTGR